MSEVRDWLKRAVNGGDKRIDKEEQYPKRPYDLERMDVLFQSSSRLGAKPRLLQLIYESVEGALELYLIAKKEKRAVVKEKVE